MKNNIDKKFLLGVDPEEKTIYFGEINLRETENEEKSFSVCFDVGEAFDINNIDEDYKEECKENYWECLDASSKGEITKEEFFEDWEKEANGYYDYIDCSCTDYEVELNNGQKINFETVCVGQHDIRKDENYNNIIFTDKKAVELILKLWTKYHLKDYSKDQETEKEIKEVFTRLKNFERFEYENIENFIKKYIMEV